MNDNPLAKHFRQPKLYIQFPSKGNFYPDGSLEETETGDYPIFAMTAKDELTMKTPDALLNGQATVSVIQSCVPNIKNAWHLPSIDVDAILIAIRIATYGEKMDLTFNIKEIDEERTFEVDLRSVLDQLTSEPYENIIDTDTVRFEVSPLSYKYFTQIAMKSFEEQRLFAAVNDDSLTDEEKLSKFNESFSRITDLNIFNVTKSVIAVQFPGEDTVTHAGHIVEFFNNTDKSIYSTVIEHLDRERDKFTVKPFKVTLPQEDIERGAPEEILIPITFDQSNFFA